MIIRNYGAAIKEGSFVKWVGEEGYYKVLRIREDAVGVGCSLLDLVKVGGDKEEVCVDEYECHVIEWSDGVLDIRLELTAAQMDNIIRQMEWVGSLPSLVDELRGAKYRAIARDRNDKLHAYPEIAKGGKA